MNDLSNIEFKKIPKTWFWVTALLLLLLSVYFSYTIYQRSSNDLLWGYRPLFLFLSVWGCITIGLTALVFKGAYKWRWFGLSGLSGVLLGLGFPGVIPFPILLFVGFVPLFVLELEVSNHTNRPGRVLWGYSYQTFVLWNIISTYWVANAALPAGLFAILVNSLLMTIPVQLYYWAKKRMPNLGPFSFLVYWLTFEYIHLNWELSWPWLTLGNGFAEFPSLIQWYEFTGHLGGTVWILILNLMLFRIWQDRRKKTKGVWVAPIAVLLTPILLSLFLYYNYQEQGRPTNVAVVQPNYEPHYVKFSIKESQQIQHFWELSETVLDQETDYLVFPESSFGYVETHDLNTYPTIKQFQTLISQYPNLKIVSGLNAFTEFRPGEPLTENTRINVNKMGDTVRYEILNIATQFDHQTRQFPIYKKSKPVPGPEIFPYQFLLSVFKPIVDQLGGTTAGIGMQKERSVFQSESGRVAPIICYESIYGEYFTKYIKKGAEAGFVVTNDGWWDNTMGHRQHLHFASLRAIETRKPIARSANTGISAFINQRGDILQATNYDEADAIARTLYFNDSKTFFVVYGNIIARVGLFASILMLLNSIVKTWQLNKQ